MKPDVVLQLEYLDLVAEFLTFRSVATKDQFDIKSGITKKFDRINEYVKSLFMNKSPEADQYR